MTVTLESNTKREELTRTLAKPAIIITLCAALGATLLVPHLVNGHLLSLSVAETQSLLIAIDLLIAGALITILNSQIVKEKVEKETLQQRLTSSFQYIGRANVALEIIKEYSVKLSASSSLNDTHQVLSHLHAAIAAGAAGATAARLRVITVDTGRTLTEFVWIRQNEGIEPPLISNKSALGETVPPANGEGKVAIRSAYQEGGVLCFFAGAIPKDSRVDTELLQLLLNHFHLLFLFTHNHHKESE
jgi:hypothetical protein